jgi:hypothetical protein
MILAYNQLESRNIFNENLLRLRNLLMMSCFFQIEGEQPGIDDIKLCS